MMAGTRTLWMAAIAAVALLGAAKPTPVPITEQIKHTQAVLNQTQAKVHNTRLKVRQALSLIHI